MGGFSCARSKIDLKSFGVLIEQVEGVQSDSDRDKCIWIGAREKST